MEQNSQNSRIQPYLKPFSLSNINPGVFVCVPFGTSFLILLIMHNDIRKRHGITYAIWLAQFANLARTRWWVVAMLELN